MVVCRPEHAPPVFDEVYLITKLALPIVHVYDTTLKREDAIERRLLRTVIDAYVDKHVCG